GSIVRNCADLCVFEKRLCIAQPPAQTFGYQAVCPERYRAGWMVGRVVARRRYRRTGGRLQ
ncbi:MAG: hypothetical protein NZ561_02000, partial [Phycisphaerae bacterium]|nr:hypothetical protein [Phycisphaerae bacterium]